jgi:hypothetical protein
VRVREPKTSNALAGRLRAYRRFRVLIYTTVAIYFVCVPGNYFLPGILLLGKQSTKSSSLMLQGRHMIRQMTVEATLPLSAAGGIGGKICRIRRRVMMRSQFAEDSDFVPFDRARGNAHSGSDDQLDKAGRTILQLVAQAAGIADENSRHALGLAQRLSEQLREAESRVSELETELSDCRERADRAEEWLHHIYGEIETRFLKTDDSRRSMNGSPQHAQGKRRAR